MLQLTVDEGFMRETYLDTLPIDADPAALQRDQLPARDKWAVAVQSNAV